MDEEPEPQGPAMLFEAKYAPSSGDFRAFALYRYLGPRHAWFRRSMWIAASVLGAGIAVIALAWTLSYASGSPYPNAAAFGGNVAFLGVLALLGGWGFRASVAGLARRVELSEGGSWHVRAFKPGFTLSAANWGIQHPWTDVAEVVDVSGVALMVLRRNKAGLRAIILSPAMQARDAGGTPVAYAKFVARCRALQAEAKAAPMWDEPRRIPQVEGYH